MYTQHGSTDTTKQTATRQNISMNKLSANNNNNNNNKFDTEEYDDQGWTPIHHAAHSGYFKTVNRLLEARPSRMEVRTEDCAKVTPLWLAFASGHVETVDILIMYGADLSVSSADDEVDLIGAAFANDQCRFLVHIMENGSAPETMNSLFWERLLENITPENLINHNRPVLETSLKVVDSLKMSSIDVESKGKPILEHILRLYQPHLICNHLELELIINNIIKSFISIHSSSSPFSSSSSSNKPHNSVVDLCRFLATKTSLYDVLTERLLQVTRQDRRVCSAILAILKACCQPKYFGEQMMLKKRFFNLVEYMAKTAVASEKDGEDVDFLVDCFEIVNRHLGDNENVQNFFNQKVDLLTIVVDLLKCKKTTNPQLKIECLKALRKLASRNRQVQTKLKNIQIFAVMRDVLTNSSTCSTNSSNNNNKATIKQVCKIICNTTSDNHQMQAHYIASGAITHLTAQIKKIKEDSSHEWIMQALYSIAGRDHRQTMTVAKALPLDYVVNLATSNSSVLLQYYGCEILNVLLRTSGYNNNSSSSSSHQVSESAAGGIMLHLLNLSLKSSFVMAKEKLVSGLRTIQLLAVGVGYVPARRLQRLALEKNSVYVLLQVVTKSNNDPWIELEVYQTIACLLFNNKDSQEILRTSSVGKFPPPVLMGYILSHRGHHRVLRRKAIHILSYFMLDKECKTVKGFKINSCDLNDNADDNNNDGDGAVKIITDSENDKNEITTIRDSRADVDTAFQKIVLKDSMEPSSRTSPAQSVFEALQVLRQGLANAEDGNVRAIAAHHISGLAQYCPGMRAAFTADELVVDELCRSMMRADEDEMVKTAVAVAIANLARCLRTEIVLFKKFRENKELFGLISAWSRAVRLPVPLCEKWKHYTSLTNK